MAAPKGGPNPTHTQPPPNQKAGGFWDRRTEGEAVVDVRYRSLGHDDRFYNADAARRPNNVISERVCGTAGYQRSTTVKNFTRRGGCTGLLTRETDLCSRELKP